MRVEEKKNMDARAEYAGRSWGLLLRCCCCCTCLGPSRGESRQRRLKTFLYWHNLQLPPDSHDSHELMKLLEEKDNVIAEKDALILALQQQLQQTSATMPP